MSENRRVLLVDDDESLLKSFKSVLEAEGLKVELARTAKEALKQTMEQKFNLYLIDILLPDIKGDELVQMIRKFDERTPILLITGYSSFQDSINIIELGIKEILLKPISPEELVRASKEAISLDIFITTSQVQP